MENKLKESPLELLWKKELEDDISGVVFAEGKIVGGTKDGELKCFGLDGNLQWKREFGTIKLDDKLYSNINGISISPNYIALCSMDKHIYVFDTNGKLRWKYKLMSESSPTKISISNEYVVVSALNTLYLFDIYGNFKWKYTAKEIYYINGVQILNNNIVFGGNTDELTCDQIYSCIYLIDVNKELRWVYKIDSKYGETLLSSSIKFINNNRISASSEYYFYLFDLKGRLKAIVDVDLNPRWSDTWNDYIVVGSDRDICLLDMDGNIKWNKSIDLEEPRPVACPIIYNGFIISSGYESLYFFNLNGDIIWKEKIADDPLCILLNRWCEYVLVDISGSELYLFKLKMKKNL